MISRLHVGCFQFPLGLRGVSLWFEVCKNKFASVFRTRCASFFFNASFRLSPSSFFSQSFVFAVYRVPSAVEELSTDQQTRSRGLQNSQRFSRSSVSSEPPQTYELGLFMCWCVIPVNEAV